MAIYTVNPKDATDLVAKIKEANGTLEADTIELAAGSTYTLTSADNTTDNTGIGGTNGQGIPVIVDASVGGALTINGNGATIERGPNAPDFRFFYVDMLGNLTLNNLTLTKGSSDGVGGAILVDSDANITINNSTISGNKSTGDGGGIYAFAAPILFTNSTLTNNTTGGNGGGIAVTASAITLKNTLVANNIDTSTATNNPDLFSENNGQFRDDGSNLIGDSTGATFDVGGTSKLIGTAATLVDPMLGALEDNGGGAKTHALLPGSKAIDAGLDANATALTTDQRGINYPRKFGTTVDIGALEALPEIQVLDGTTDIVDGTTTAINVGNTTVGTPVNKTFTIKNLGGYTLNLSGLTLPTGFTVVGNLPTTIAGNKQADLVVKLDATTVGDFTGKLEFTTDDSEENPFDFPIVGKVIGTPEIQVLDGTTDIVDGTTTAVNVGNTTVGTPVNKTFTIKNLGGYTLNLSGLSLPAGFSVVGNLPTTIGPNQQADLVVKLEATSFSNFTGKLQFTTDDIDENPFDFPIVGKVIGTPEIKVLDGTIDIVDGTTTAVNMGNTTVGGAVNKTFTIKNLGSAALNLSGLSLPTGFTVVGSLPTTIAVNEQANLVVKLDGTTVGDFTGNLQFTTDDIDENPFDFPLVGKVTAAPAPEIQVLDGTTKIDDGATTPVNVGNPTVGTLVNKTFTIKNLGSAALNLSRLSLPKGFTLVGNFPATIAANQQANLVVKLDTKTVGDFTGTLQFNTNDSKANTFDFPLVGKVTAEPEIQVLLKGTNNIPDDIMSINMGNTTVGKPLTETFTIKNRGSAALKLSELTLPTGFSVVGNLPTTIEANQQADLVVKLDATTAGNFTGKLQFTTNDSDENPFDFGLGSVVKSDNTPASGVINFGSSSYSVNAGKSVNVDVNRSKTDALAKVNYEVVIFSTTKDSSAALGSDYLINRGISGSGTLEFPQGVSSQSIRIDALENKENKSPEVINLRLSNPTTGQLNDLSDTTITISPPPALPSPPVQTTPPSASNTAGSIPPIPAQPTPPAKDTLPPEVIEVSVPNPGNYEAGQDLYFTVKFSEAVDVSRYPTLPLTIGDQTVNATLVWDSSGSQYVLFRYRVKSEWYYNDSDGITVNNPTDFAETIKDMAGNASKPTLNGVGDTSKVFVDNVEPFVDSVIVPNQGSYKAGQDLYFTVKFSEKVNVNGNPTLPLTIGNKQVNATYVSASGSQDLLFRYTVESGDNDSDGITVDNPTNFAETIKDRAGNASVSTLYRVGDTSKVLVDNSNPTVTSVIVPNQGNYRAGQNLDFTVKFGEVVNVSGNPTLGLTIGNKKVNATYVSGSGSQDLLFRYTVESGDSDNNGITVDNSTNFAETIKDRAGYASVSTLYRVGDTSKVFVDNIRPTVTRVIVPNQGSYQRRANLDFTVKLSEAVNVSGNPTLPLTIGEEPVNATYVSGSGSQDLLFRYRVELGDSDSDGITVNNPTNFAETITDMAGNALIPTLKNVGNTSKVIVVRLASEPLKWQMRISQQQDDVERALEKLNREKRNMEAQTPRDEMKLKSMENKINQMKIEQQRLNLTLQAVISSVGGLENYLRAILTQDGPISGATAFFDANRNGIQDGDEPATTTQPDGSFEIGYELLAKYDTNQNGELEPNEGRFMVVGGVDTATNLPLAVPMLAPGNALMVTPLTSVKTGLVAQGMTPEAANAAITKGFNLPSDVDVATYDPLAAIAFGEADGVPVFGAGVQFQNTITLMASLLSGLSGTPTSDPYPLNVADAGSILINLANGQPVDLSQPAVLTQMITEVAQAAAQNIPNFNPSQIDPAVIAAGVQAIANSNKLIQSATQSGGSPKDVALNITKAQAVSMGELAQNMQDLAAGKLPLADFVAKSGPEALSSRLEQVSVKDPTAGVVLPGPDDDNFFGTSGNDTYNGLVGDDLINGLEGDDTLYGGKGNDLIDGGDGNDILYGNNGNDLLLGGLNDDTLYGGKDNDILAGDEGNDWLFGNLGDDELTGDAGADNFVLALNQGTDQIIDFTPGEDKIILAGLKFEDLTISQQTTDGISDTVIQTQNPVQTLAILPGFNQTLSSDNFGVL